MVTRSDESSEFSFGVRWNEVECVNAMDESVTKGEHHQDVCAIVDHIKEHELAKISGKNGGSR
jgi:hypothetical protein